MKILKKIRTYLEGLFYGMKITEDQVLKQSNESITAATEISQEVTSNRVSGALLRGELTEEVKELRYRNYKVDREAKKYEYFSPTLSIHKDRLNKQDNKFIAFENEDNLEVVTVQENKEVVQNINDFNMSAEKNADVEGNFKTSEKVEHTIKATRDFIPRYRIEDFASKLVVRKYSKTLDLLDLYITKYALKSVNVNMIMRNGLIHEIEKIRDNGVKSDILDIKTIGFVTSNAYKKVDLLEYQFDRIKFVGVYEYDGSYILRFKGRVVKDGVDLTDKYYNKTMDEKYQKKAKKDVIIDPFGTYNTATYVCEMCGKEIVYDTEVIDMEEIRRPREIDEEVDENSVSVSEYFDAQISKVTTGKFLCKDCLEKYVYGENNKDKSDKK